MIRIQDLYFSYGRNEPVLRGINLTLSKGKILGLLGPNGSGKSTLLNCIAGLFRPTSGILSIAGFFSPKEEKKIREKVGLVLQEADLQILGASLGEDLCLGIRTDSPESLARARKLAKRFALLDKWESNVQNLSWGQKRKLAISSILVTSPEVLLLDEPFSGLDYTALKEMRKIIIENQKHGLTQIITAHDIEPMADLVDTWAILYQGSLVLSGDYRRVFRSLKKYGIRPPCSWSSKQCIIPWE